MLHSPDLARPFQVANTHSWVVSENSDKAIEDITPLIRDRAIWPAKQRGGQNSQ